jgi:hypothetical protein
MEGHLPERSPFYNWHIQLIENAHPHEKNLHLKWRIPGIKKMLL